MATINYLYRSTKNQAPLTLRLLYRHREVDYTFDVKTKLETDKHYWAKQHKLQRVKDIELLNKQAEINSELTKLSNYILTLFNSIPESNIVDVVNKNWLKTQVDFYYNPPKSIEESEQAKIPTDLISYIDFYLDYRKNEISEALRKKNNVVKNKLIRFQKKHKKTILIKDVNDKFKNEFVSYCIEDGYAQNTIHRELVFIKTCCKHARYLGLEVHPQMDNLRLERQKVQSIYLSFQELEQIEQTLNLPEYLENAKDWLIISCYLGQRVSDFLTFTSEMIRYEEHNGEMMPLLEFTQKKTGKIMTIPVHKKVIEILDKRGGEFPRKITDVNYNLYIKEVCKEANLTEVVKGSKKVETAPNSKKYRKETKMFPKYELVSSHIGRRSFATNFYGKIPTTYLIYITGHSTEQMFLTYIGKSNKDLAKDIFNYF